jgi:hypothetical protein
MVLQVIAHGAILWISYPKGSSGVKTDLNRDELWQAMGENGIWPVTRV